MSGGGKGGGGTQKTVSEPWKESQPYLKDIFGQAQELAGQPKEYFPGSTTVGALPSEQKAWNQLFSANQQNFGQGGTYGQATQALGNSLTGNTTLGGMANALAPDATNSLISGIQGGPASVGRYGFNTQLNPYSMAPQFGKAGGLDANPALQGMLSGQPDYSGVQGAIDAANAPIMRQLEQEIIPGLNSKATFLNNGTGGIKALNRVMPEIGERMSQNATGIMEGERQRALGAQERAAGMVSQGGLQSYGMGLDASSRQAGLQQALAGQNLSTDQSNAALQGDYRNQLLNYGSLAGQLGNQQGAQSMTAAGMFPGLAQAGQMPGQTGLQYANWDRALQEDQLNANIDRFNFGQNEPTDRLNWYSQLMNGMAGLGGTQSGTMPQGSRAGSALGGAVSGAQLGSSYGPWGTLIGGIGGGLLGGYG